MFFFQRKKLNREEFEAFKNQQNDLFDRLAALERSINDLRSQPTVVSDEKKNIYIRVVVSCCSFNHIYMQKNHIIQIFFSSI